MIIYKATNLVNGKCYIGLSTNSLEWRIKKHYGDALYRPRNTTLICKALRKYKKEDWTWEVIHETDDLSNLKILERMYIRLHNSYAKGGRGYNCTLGGDSNPMDNPEIVKKLVATKRRNGSYKMSNEQKLKLSIAHRGKSLSKQHRAKLVVVNNKLEKKQLISNTISNWWKELKANPVEYEKFCRERIEKSLATRRKNKAK